MGGALYEAFDLVRCGVGNDKRFRFGRVERAANAGHEYLSDVAPVRKGWVQFGAHLPRSKV